MEKKLFGKTRDGNDVELISIENGNYKLSVLTFGATLYYYGTKDLNIILNHERLDDYFDDTTYMGEVVGPVANRIKSGVFSLDGKTYSVDRNEGNNNLHSGSACYGQKLWSVIGVGANSITLAISTEDGAGGFPGSHDVSVTYSIYDDGALNIQYKAHSTKKCPVALTNHSYFNLSGGKDIRETELSIDADLYVAVDSELIPTSVLPVEKSDYDFRKPVAIGARLDGKYDNTYVLNTSGTIYAVGEKAYLKCRTTEPSVQLYTGEFIKGEHKPFSGFCLETGRYPDTPNRDDFPKAFMEPGKEFISNTTYVMGVR